ncbi:MAG: hypothetical protein ACQKBW_10690 [Puniceicoccales bacterium]
MSLQLSTSGNTRSLPGALFLFVFGAFFAGMGGVALNATLEKGDQPLMAYALCSLFIVVGLGVIGLAFYTLVKGNESKKLAQRYPGQPWLHNKTWASGRIKDSGLSGVVILGFFAAFWNLIAWGATIAMLNSGDLGREPATYFVLLFPLIGIGLAGATVYQLLRWRKYGTSVFELAEIPGVIGGNLGGVILTKAKVHPEEGFKLKLRNVHEWTSGSGKNRSTHRETLWEDEQTIEQEAFADDPARTALPVLFFIPYSCKPTERINARTQNYWELTASAKSPGVDYKSTFRVPVFITPESSADARPPETNAYAAPPPLADISSIPGLTIRPDFSGAEVLELRPLRHLLLLLFPVIIGAGMIVGAVFAWNSSMPKIFPLVFLGFGLLIAYGICTSLLAALRISLFDDRLEIRRGILVPSKLQTIPRERIERMEAHQSMSSGNTAFYNIKIHTTDGQTVSLPTLIKDRHLADAFIARLEQ